MSANLTGYPFGFTTVVLPLTATDFLCADTGDNILPLEVVNYNSTNGRIYAWVGTDLLTASDTIVYLYWNA